MDLSWCIICDNRIEDDELSMVDSNNSLYCSQECKLKDEQTIKSTPFPLPCNITLSPNSTTTTTTTPAINKSWMTKKSAKYHHYRPTAPTTTYPWIPLYRKRHNYLTNAVKRCCQPTVAGSPVTATAVLSSSLIR